MLWQVSSILVNRILELRLCYPINSEIYRDMNQVRHLLIFIPSALLSL
jgi:hypothetical protein